MTTSLLRQTWTMSAVLINMLCQGMVLSYPSCLLPALNHPDSPIKVDLNLSSWLGSIAGLIGIPGFLITSALMTYYGRKITQAITIIPSIIGWLFIYFAQDVPTLMIGRFFCTLFSAATVALGAIIIGEYTSPEYRGVFLYLKNASVCMGAMLIHIVSHSLHWRTVALISLGPIFLSLLINYTWPESPAWLVSKQQYEKSEEAFYWLRGRTEVSRKEIESIVTVQKAELLRPKIKSNFCDKVIACVRKFTQKNFLKPFFIMILATAVLELSGRHIFPAYALQILAEITGETSLSFYCTIGFDIVITTCAIFASILVKIMNRRTLLFSTGLAALIVLMLVCLYLFLVSKGIIPFNDKSWLPMSLLLLYFSLANLGCAPIPLALIGEVFPLAHRGMGSALSGIWFSICLLAGLKSTPHLLVSIKVYGLFALSGSIMGTALLILYFTMPETKDKTLQEIENYFNHGTFMDDTVQDEEANIKIMNEANYNKIKV